MEFMLDCLPCMLRQVLEASKMATDDTRTQNTIMQQALAALQDYATFANAPTASQALHAIIRRHTGADDPYRAVKQRDIALAKRVLPGIRSFVRAQDDALYWALKAGATGNSLDSAVMRGPAAVSLEDELQKPFAVCDIERLRDKLQTAKTLLVIGDNAGETVLDCVLLEAFPALRITYAVRSAPVLNDATAAEALDSGLGDYAEVIGSGSRIPGTMLADCSEAFLAAFHGADIVISKGQGNFETLSDCPRDVFFLLKAKCPAVAGLLDVGMYEYVFRYKP